MNLKLRAALVAIGVVSSGLLTGFVLSQLPNWAVAVVILVFALAIIYNLALAGLKFDESIDKMNSKYTDK